MTLFNLEKEDQGDWFAFFSSRFDPATGEVIYDKPEEGAAEFRIRNMQPFWEDIWEGRKKEHKMVVNPLSRSMERVGYYEDLPADEARKENDDAWDYSITGIKDAFSAPGVPIECTRENKLALIEMPVFVRFVRQVFEIISEAGVKQKEDSEKN
jgi:hypothetical protein